MYFLCVYVSVCIYWTLKVRISNCKILQSVISLTSHSVQNQVILERFTSMTDSGTGTLYLYVISWDVKWDTVEFINWFHLLPWFVDEELQDLLTETLDMSESRHEEKPPLQHPVKETSCKNTLKQASGSSAKRNKRCDWKYSTCSSTMYLINGQYKTRTADCGPRTADWV